MLMIDPPVAGQCANAQACRGGWHSLYGQAGVFNFACYRCPKKRRVDVAMSNAKPPAGILFMSNKAEYFKDILRFGECDGCEGVNAGTYMHICPYAEDMYGDNDDVCNCCSECTHICVQEI